MTGGPITVVAAVNDRGILCSNLLQSPLLKPGHHHQLLIREGFASASLAYNDALDEARHEIVVFVHQDVYLPPRWLGDLYAAINRLEAEQRPWGVIGCFGSRRDAPGGVGSVYSTGWGLQGKSISVPEKVETLDEIVLVIRRSSGLRFDPQLANYHLYGTDICLAAHRAGRPCYVMPTCCVHNTTQLLALPPEFYACYRYIKRKWRRELPIAASCITLTRFDGPMIRKKIEAVVDRLRGRGATGAPRLEDPRSALPDPVAGSLSESQT